MEGTDHPLTRRAREIFLKPGFWFILALLALVTLLHYEEALEQPPLLSQLMSDLGFTRHAFERVLYLAPIVWAGFLFGWKGATVTSLLSLAGMMPRVFLISLSPVDAVFETSAVFIVGNVLAISFYTLRKEREYRHQLEATQQELEASEHRYRRLFENANDAIWVQDMEGGILAANEAAARLTGFDVERLVQMKVSDFLSQEGLELAREMNRKLRRGKTIEGPYDQRINRGDGTERLIRLSSSLIRSDGEPVGFQHIARDVTRDKQMQDNLRYYLEQTAKAQEEERKRISRELHDETIQSLVVLSRQLDDITSSDKGLSKQSRTHLQELWQQTDQIIKGVRRLSQDLRPAALDSLGLLPAIEWLATDTAEYSGIATKVNITGRERRIPEEIGLVLFRIAQEALRNVWRHSQASKAEINVEFAQDKTRITISDNGKGFSLPETISDLARDGKLGLAGMEERARLIGGTLKVQSRPGKGTSIAIELPA